MNSSCICTPLQACARLTGEVSSPLQNNLIQASLKGLKVTELKLHETFQCSPVNCALRTTRTKLGQAVSSSSLAE